MDARITKQRLANLISYDWLKILVTIAAFVLVLVVLFTTTATRPAKEQQIAIYAHTDLQPDEDFSDLAATLLKRDVFSYDILSVTSESFAGNSYASATFAARRAAGQGNAMFITDNPVYKTDDDGGLVLGEDGEPEIESASELYNFAAGAVDETSRASGAVYDTEYFLSLCEEYLISFFGDDWRTNDAFDGERTPAGSFSRNAKDKRYRTDEQKAQGLKDEEARLKKLREDYLAVDGALESGTFRHTVYTFEENGETYEKALGIDVGGLNRLKELVYYEEDGVRTTKNVNLVILYNNYLDGHDLCFEIVSFLNYLLEHYA